MSNITQIFWNSDKNSNSINKIIITCRNDRDYGVDWRWIAKMPAICPWEIHRPIIIKLKKNFKLYQKVL